MKCCSCLQGEPRSRCQERASGWEAFSRREHSTFNIQHSTSKEWPSLRPLNVGRWMLNVECFPFENEEEDQKGNWRRWMGIEPTWDFVEPHHGFEDQERHQVALRLHA